MTYQDLIVEVTKRLEWPEEKISAVIGTIWEIVSGELKMSNPVIIDHFGTLKTDIQPEYILVDLEVKERYLMPPSVEIVFEDHSADKGEDSVVPVGFIPDDTLYHEVNSSFSHFEPTLLNEGVQFPDIQEVIIEEELEDRSPEPLSIEVEPIEDEPILLQEAEEPVVSEKPEHSPPRFRSRRGKKNNKKVASVWIPIVGGVAIVVAVLFFFKGEENR